MGLASENNEGAKAWIGDSTEIIDCNGKSIIPGLGDAHMYLSNAAKKYGSCSFSDIVPNPETDTPENVLKRMQEKLKTYADEHKDTPVIRGIGWDRSWFSGGLQGIKMPLTSHRRSYSRQTGSPYVVLLKLPESRKTRTTLTV